MTTSLSFVPLSHTTSARLCPLPGALLLTNILSELLFANMVKNKEYSSDIIAQIVDLKVLYIVL